MEESQDKFTNPEIDTTLASVDRISRDYNVFFVHKIVPKYVTHDDKWTPLKEGFTDLNILMKVVIATEPHISCSTISEGDTEENFAKETEGIGLLINGGRVTFAAATDAFTTFGEHEKSQEGNIREKYEGDIGLTPLAEQLLGQQIKSEEDIRIAIQFRRKSMKEVGRYLFTPFNEFAVNDPKVGAIFTVVHNFGRHGGNSLDIEGENDLDNLFRKYDNKDNSFLIDDEEAEKLELAKRLAEEMEIPNLVFFRGSFYKIVRIQADENVEPDEPRKMRVFLGEKITVEHALSMENPLSKDPSKRSVMVKEVYKAKPFRVSNVARLARKKL